MSGSTRVNMANSKVSLACNSIIEFNQLNRVFSHSLSLRAGNSKRIPLNPQKNFPNLLLSQPSSGIERAVWLLHRPTDVLGLLVRPRSEIFRSLPQEYEIKNPRIDRVIRHLKSLPFQMVEGKSNCSLMVIHKNHLIGWCLNGTAAPLYVHSIDQLSRLKLSRLKTLSPENSFICNICYQWDNWREVSMEPGWSWHLADEYITDGLVNGRTTFEELRSCTTEVS